MAVRSKRLWGPTALGSSSTVLYTCPDGETAILKTLALNSTAVGGATFGVYLNGNGTNNRIALYTVSATDQHLVVDLFVVLHPGDTLRIAPSVAGGSSTGFGAELEGVAD